MGSSSISASKVGKKLSFGLIIMILIIMKSEDHQVSCHPHHSQVQHFKVGDEKGWIIPSSNQTHFFTQWAMGHNFCVNDTLYFKYQQNDSVVQVSQKDYENCNTSNPINKQSSFGGERKTTIKLHDIGCTYFISGILSHCKAGQRMAVFVDLYRPAPYNDSAPPSFRGFTPMSASNHNFMHESCILDNFESTNPDSCDFCRPWLNSANRLKKITASASLAMAVVCSSFMLIFYIMVTSLVY